MNRRWRDYTEMRIAMERKELCLSCKFKKEVSVVLAFLSLSLGKLVNGVTVFFERHGVLRCGFVDC